MPALLLLLFAMATLKNEEEAEACIPEIYNSVMLTIYGSLFIVLRCLVGSIAVGCTK